MSYYHNYRRRRYYSPYYFRNYSKPNYYYHHKSYGSYNNSFNFWKWFFILLGSYYIILLISSKINPGLLFILAIAIVIIVFTFRRYKKSNNSTAVGLNNPNITKEQIAEINSEKHGCKCYMEGLTAGEQEVAHILSEGLSYKDYFIFNNLTIPSTLNGSSQIDHLVVSKFGIFVIESKDYKGWIFGSKDKENWTQSLPGGEKKFQFQNPIRQNYSHIIALQDLIPFVNKDSFESIVVFMDSCELKTPIIENIIHPRELIKSIQKFNQNKISEEKLHLIIGKLSYMCQTLNISPSQHIENLNAHHDNK
ncbi:MAG: nuclease-related domain-containing protein [Minisyncoccia bacterium]